MPINMTTTFLTCTTFADGTDLAYSDQVLVPRTVWDIFDRAQQGQGHGQGQLAVVTVADYCLLTLPLVA